MPELPEVETVRLGLTPALVGERLSRVAARRPALRLPIPVDLVQRLTGKVVGGLDRRAKYLLLRMIDGPVALIHLGMSGSMTVGPLAGHAEPGPHDHILFETAAGLRVTFRDPRRFGLITLAEPETLDDHPLLAKLGPEPLSEAFDAEVLVRRLNGRQASIKAALLDQGVVAGLGNIYVSEALFRAGISPLRPAASVTGAWAEALVTAIRAVLGEAIAAGGSSLRDHRQTDGALGYFQHSFAVYDRVGLPCPGCDCDVARTGGIERMVQSGRSTFFCGRRQR
ncbi:DNA-formamidopyrimidine glycosylase [Rhodospirillum rubrum]|uniref:bifunctional DNA-formamidopyrimidine glycosylase/DNA-(apurinic or apyrimidinic site) lyase n=1 Tax=Rhodospirillum rubrum TaxID=1085 RepID=UPI001906CB05|nr:bifunctional DNA-formamidopyrimidine glycosylase/DNA-(apurinic or apyrimidinic site) lyase [Rhodospirillum rubrum]MBK1664983.1 DNA-formamidopyrimidine glycosylase [Rhodospirillum rubrum]MBK1677272.1 DNA-formamidopyrimidine glycosylase [Rhodospirillum rubrum]